MASESKSKDPAAVDQKSAAPAQEKPIDANAGDQKRGRRRQESRTKLLTAARRLFVERGYHDTRPQDIAKAADVGHGTFYLHFPDKRACFFAFVNEACAELDDRIAAGVTEGEGLSSQIERVLAAVIDYHLDNPGVLAAALGSPGVIDAGNDHRVEMLGGWACEWAKKLSSYAERDLVHKDYDFGIIGWMIVGMFNPLCTADIVDQDNRDHVIANMKRLIIRGLAKTQD